ncbi:hypothetical protein [Mycobacterium sp. IEC1808]|uniref:hypothetical protein n=1 Tax=Mycobacterium sp. IEC1808 TaxID=1743230 RepID=UPI001302AC66|nr:hypothetical protein [Mycobacterium sp. IEC1808]
MVTGVMATVAAPADAAGVLPLGCGITWTRTGGVWIYQPDCPQQPPPSEPSPESPPPGPPPPPPTP